MSASGAGRAGDELGVGLIGTIAGITIILAIITFATQIAFSLYATSAVTAIAYDAARVVAGSDGGDTTDAEAEARVDLGRYSDRVAMAWRVDDDAVVLHVRAEHPSFLPAALRQPLGVQVVDRTIRVRRERFR